MRSRTRLVVVLFVLAAMLSLAVPAFAVSPGRTGASSFTSGRTAGDASADIFR